MKHPETISLYKYRAFSSRTITALSNDELYFASSDSFNDPFDCRARKEFYFKDDGDFIDKWSELEAKQQNLSINQARKYVSEIVSNKQKEDYIKIKSEQFQKIVLQSFGVCSFSDINNDILMWSHYADSHKGLCLGFKRAPGNMLEHSQPIEYPKNHDFPDINYWLGSTDEQLGEIEKIILTKSKHWSYEQEWRIIHRPPNTIKDSCGHLVNYPKDMLQSIIFGYRMKNKERKAIRKILASYSVNYYEAKPVKDKFLLEVVKV